MSQTPPSSLPLELLLSASARSLVNAAALREGNLAKIEQAARELVGAVLTARESILERH